MTFKVIYLGCSVRSYCSEVAACFECIGQEFQAVFLSTTEPVGEDGNTLNPTKSPCDRYIFNTILTRAKSLVVVVGSPRVLLKTEQHMVRLYGAKGRCWSLYLKSCIENDTLIIPSLVEADKNVTENFVAELAATVGATLPRKSSRANYRTRGTIPKGGTHTVQSTDSQHSAIQPKSRIHLVDKHLSGDENVFKQMSQVTSRSSSSFSQSAVQPIVSVPVAIYPERSTITRSLNSNVAMKQSVPESPRSYKSTSSSSPSLSRPKQGRNVEAPKSRSKGINSWKCCIYQTYGFTVLLGDDFPKAPKPKTPAASSVTLPPPLTAASATVISLPPQKQRSAISRIASDTKRISTTKTVAAPPITQISNSRPAPTEPTKSRRASNIEITVNVVPLFKYLIF